MPCIACPTGFQPASGGKNAAPTPGMGANIGNGRHVSRPYKSGCRGGLHAARRAEAIERVDIQHGIYKSGAKFAYGSVGAHRIRPT